MRHTANITTWARVIRDDLERLEQARRHELDQQIKRARMGILPFRRPQRGKPGYWWRRKWRPRALLLSATLGLFR
jgi:hypothetical protein